MLLQLSLNIMKKYFLTHIYMNRADNKICFLNRIYNIKKEPLSITNVKYY